MAGIRDSLSGMVEKPYERLQGQNKEP